MTLAEILAEAMDKKGFDAAELCAEAEVTRSTLYNWRAGRCGIGPATAAQATKVAVLLGVAPKRLFSAPVA